MLSCVCDELGGDVPNNVKEKIWKGEFVELGSLLKRDNYVVSDDSQLQAFNLCATGSALICAPNTRPPQSQV